MPKASPMKSVVEGLLAQGKTPSEIRAVFPALDSGYVSTIRSRSGIAPFTYENRNGSRVDGKRIGPITKEWLCERRFIDERGCWNWTLSCFKDGYAKVKSRMKCCRVSRIAYELWCGPIPTGLGILHTCDNPKCFNPEHLFPGTCHDNSVDASRKRRTVWSTFSPEQVLEIRASKESPTVVGNRHGVTCSAICAIRSGKSYSWVTDLNQPNEPAKGIL